uniref:Dynactin subunit 4 n=2 Tax=Kalmanozyma brasiliensis (strain GHG001) TaxID=1365824 RepID=V5GN84_KALBG
MGVVAKREKHRRDYVSRLHSTPGQPFASLDDKISSLEQRWSAISIADQPVRAAELRPTRVPLKSKLSKRCPACRHIVIKPDIKAASNRFKIKLVALNFLPEIQVSLAPHQPFLDPHKYRSATGSSLMGAGTATSTLRRRPPSVLVSGTDSLSGSSSLMVTSQDVDADRLEVGHTYSFQIAVSNPLDDAIQVEMSFVRFALPSHLRTSTDGGSSAVQPFPQAKYIFSAKTDTGVSSPVDDQVHASEQSAGPSKRSRLGWQVYPSATSVPLNAFNEVWDLEDAEDLYGSKAEADATRQESGGAAQSRAVRTAIARGTDESSWVIEEEDDGEDDAESEDRGISDIDEEQEDAARSKRSKRLTRQPQLFASSGMQRKPFIQRGHTTTLYLDLAISDQNPPRPGPLELGMHVTYRYTTAATVPDEQAARPPGKDFSFWTSIRLGSVAAAGDARP